MFIFNLLCADKQTSTSSYADDIHQQVVSLSVSPGIIQALS